MRAEVELPPDPRSVRDARRFVRGTLADWLLGELEEDVELMVSELVSNAVLHAGTVMTLEAAVQREDGCTTLRMSVHDLSPRSPHVNRYSQLASTGRGLGIVDTLASRHGVTRASERVEGAVGKAVWFEVPTPAGWDAGVLSATS